MAAQIFEALLRQSRINSLVLRGQTRHEQITRASLKNPKYLQENPAFLRYNRYLKIALRLINRKESVITTVHGQYNLPGSNMEEIK